MFLNSYLNPNTYKFPAMVCLTDNVVLAPANQQLHIVVDVKIMMRVFAIIAAFIAHTFSLAVTPEYCFITASLASSYRGLKTPVSR